MLKVYRTVLFKIVLLILISFSILILSILFHAFNKRIYRDVYSNSNIYHNTNYTEKQYLEEIENYERYLMKEDDGSIKSDNRYTEDEILHMEDVRNLFRFAKIYSLGISFLTIYFVLTAKKRELKKFFKLSFLIPILIVLPAIINFDIFWIFFHKVLFRNDLWMMDPYESLMINLLPQEVFNKITINVITTFFIFSFIFIVLVYGIYRLRREDNEIKQIF